MLLSSSMLLGEHTLTTPKLNWKEQRKWHRSNSEAVLGQLLHMRASLKSNEIHEDPVGVG